MNMQIQNYLEQLVDLNCPKITQKRKAILLSLFNRVLNHDFGNEILDENQLQMSLVQNSSVDKSRTLNILTHLQSKHSLVRRNHVLYCLLKISEDTKQMQQSQMYQSGFSTKYSKMSVRTLPNISVQFNQSNLTYKKPQITSSLMSPYQQVLKDLVSCFQGINCQYFEYDVGLQMFILKIKYEKLFSIPLRKFLCELNEIGFLYMKIQEVLSKKKQKQESLVFQCVLGAVKEEMNQFFEFLASLDNYQKCNEILTPNFFYPVYFYARPQFQKMFDLSQVFCTAFDMTSSQNLSYFYLVSKNNFIEEKQFL